MHGKNVRNEFAVGTAKHHRHQNSCLSFECMNIVSSVYRMMPEMELGQCTFALALKANTV